MTSWVYLYLLEMEESTWLIYDDYTTLFPCVSALKGTFLLLEDAPLFHI